MSTSHKSTRPASHHQPSNIKSIELKLEMSEPHRTTLNNDEPRPKYQPMTCLRPSTLVYSQLASLSTELGCRKMQRLIKQYNLHAAGTKLLFNCFSNVSAPTDLYAPHQCCVPHFQLTFEVWAGACAAKSLRTAISKKRSLYQGRIHRSPWINQSITFHQ